MAENETLERVLRRALNKHEKHLFGLENVHGLGIVETKPAAKSRGHTRSTGHSSDQNEHPDAEVIPRDKEQARQSPLAVAVYVDKKVPTAELQPDQIIPETLDIEFNGRHHMVRVKVIEEAAVSFEEESFSTDQL